jgi:hypothetical protein
MKNIKFDGTVGIMSGKNEEKKVSYLIIKKGIGTGKRGEKVKDERYHKNKIIDLKTADVVFTFSHKKSIDVIIKALKIAKKNLKKQK